MHTEKVSLTLEKELLAEAREVVGARGLSGYVRALGAGVPVEVPVVVVAETVRGGPRDAPVNRVLKAVGSVSEAREVHGRTAGRLLGAARSSHTVDALVVAHAVESGGAHILTGDREDLERLAASNPEVWIHPL